MESKRPLTDFTLKEIGLSVECPLYGKRIPVEGWCFDFVFTAKQKEKGNVRVYGKKDNIFF